MCVGHANDMVSPSELALHYCGGDTEHVGLLQNADVGTSVLPADPEFFVIFGDVVPGLSGACCRWSMTQLHTAGWGGPRLCRPGVLFGPLGLALH